LYGLSEQDTERWLNESLPARYLADLALDQMAPDHSSLTVFKQRLVANGNWEEVE
jgi:hypothetical protein